MKIYSQNILLKLIRFIYSLSYIPRDVLIFYYLAKKLSHKNKVSFVYTQTRRIGNIAYQPDIFLIKHSEEKIIFIYSDKPCNQLLLDTLSRNRSIFFHKLKCNFSLYIFQILAKYKLLKINQLDFNDLHLVENAPPSAIYPRFFFLSPKSALKQKKLLDSLSIKKENYIVLHTRDSAYLQNTLLDGNYHSYRDSNIESTQKGLKEIIDSQKAIVRITRHKNDNFIFNNSSYIDMTSKNGNEDWDLLFLEGCKYLLGCNSGLLWTCRLFRKPCLILNMIPFNLKELSSYPGNSIFIPKLIFNNNLQRYLTFSEMSKISFKNIAHYKGDYFSDNGLKIIDNSSEEIFEAIKEMNYFLSMRKDFINDILNTQHMKMFLDLFKDNHTKSLFIKNKIFPSKSFLEKHNELIC